MTEDWSGIFVPGPQQALGGPGLASGCRPHSGLMLTRGKSLGLSGLVGSATVLGLCSVAVMETAFPGTQQIQKNYYYYTIKNLSILFCMKRLHCFCLTIFFPPQISVQRKYNFLLLKHNIERQSVNKISIVII